MAYDDAPDSTPGPMLDRATAVILAGASLYLAALCYDAATLQPPAWGLSVASGGLWALKFARMAQSAWKRAAELARSHPKHRVWPPL